MPFTWTEELATGHPVIDAQHREIFKALDNFRDLTSEGKGREGVGAALKFTADYISKHFSDEEGIQARSNYPDRVNHKGLHEAFKKVVADLLKEFNEQGPTIMLFNKVNTNLGRWVVNHVINEDKKVAAHIRAAGQ